MRGPRDCLGNRQEVGSLSAAQAPPLITADVEETLQKAEWPCRGMGNEEPPRSTLLTGFSSMYSCDDLPKIVGSVMILQVHRVLTN